MLTDDTQDIKSFFLAFLCWLARRLSSPSKVFFMVFRGIFMLIEFPFRSPIVFSHRIMQYSCRTIECFFCLLSLRPPSPPRMTSHFPADYGSASALRFAFGASSRLPRTTRGAKHSSRIIKQKSQAKKKPSISPNNEAKYSNSR